MRQFDIKRRKAYELSSLRGQESAFNAIWYKIPLSLKYSVDSAGLAKIVDLASVSYQVGKNRILEEKYYRVVS